MALKGCGFINIFNISGSFLGISYYEYFTDITTGRKKYLQNIILCNGCIYIDEAVTANNCVGTEHYIKTKEKESGVWKTYFLSSF